MAPPLSPLESAFAASTISIETDDSFQEKDVNKESTAGGTSTTINATAYYRDSSGRARLSLRVRLQCPSDENLWNAILSSGIVNIPPDENGEGDGDETSRDQKEDAHDGNNDTKTSLIFECLCRFGDDDFDLDEITVEGVTIISSSVLKSEHALLFDVETVVRASYLDGGGYSTTNGNNDGTNNNNMAASVADKRTVVTQQSSIVTPEPHDSEDDNSAGGGNSRSTSSSDSCQVLTTEIDIRAVLELKKSVPPPIIVDDPLSPTFDTLGLLALDKGSGILPLPPTTASTTSYERYDTQYLRSCPVTVHLLLVKALTLSVREVGASRSATGATLVSLTVSHSNLHPSPVTITNITLHPGHSRLAVNTGRQGRSMAGGHLSVIDMNRHVTWGYAPGTTPSFPLLLKPSEAYSTVLQIDAGEDLRSRPFFSPVAVTAFVGEESEDQLVIATDAQWTTARVAVEPVDAFRVDMSLREKEYKIGKPFVVSLKVLNLSNDDRDLMLLMAKDDDNSDGKGGGQKKYAAHSVNTAVVSEVNGYTFGVWGLAGEDDGTMRHNRDHELLAVDAALLLGEVKGQHSIEAELRFVPLREGTLDVPNLKLYDKMGGKWYNCVHRLKVVASSR
mmetsp:Transcript_64076/g.75858  ORF Transcript_64076/g.75858 Transcript_64076/m.75858 type:complete len:619 (-) Transcript_64076:14-1870(-)